MTIQEIIGNAKHQAIIDQMQDFSDNEKLSLWNDYCADNMRYDNQVYENNDEFFEEILGSSTNKLDLLRMAYNGDYNPNHDYVSFNGYGNLVSSDYVEDLMYWDEETLANWALENECWLIDWEYMEECAKNSLEIDLKEATSQVEDENLDMTELYDYVVNNCEDMEVKEAVANYIESIQE